MGTEKRLLIAIVLSLLVLLLYPYFFNIFYPTPEKGVEGKKEGVALEQIKAPAVAEEPWVVVKAPAALTVPVSPPPFEEELVTVETPLIKAVFTTAGGAVKSWELKDFKNTMEETSGIVDIAATVANTKLLQTLLVSTGIPETIPFKSSKRKLFLGSQDRAELVFRWESPDGVRVEKKYTFTGSGYAVATELKISNGSTVKLQADAETLLVANYKEETPYYHSGPVRHIKDKVERQDAESPPESGRGPVNWLGLEDKYFLLALVPEKDAAVEWESEVPSIDTARLKLSVPLELNPGESRTISHNAYLGPKIYDRLLSYGVGLEDAIEFGFLSFLAKPFLVVLNFFEKFLKNYALAIILLTGIIKVVFYPLTKHSLNSMKEMQKIQPQLSALRQKYKDDKEKLNKELMGLYKRYKINPLGGCLPMLMQIPVFIALYEVLSVAIELRHAPFAFWIMDLSAKDPYYITPVLMGASMLIQQKMTPSTMDPMQAKMMLIMPIVFTFLFMSFPSGLVLYWLVNNVLSIAQQYHIYKGKK